MAKCIKREELVAWLKRIPVKDLSDGLGLCRIIMEEDFKRAIRTIPKGAIVDLTQVVHCRECECFKPSEDGIYYCYRNKLGNGVFMKNDDFCSYGVRKNGHEHG